jgi:hypothetical protein
MIKIAAVLILVAVLLVTASACVVVVTNASPNYYGTGVTTYYGTVLPKAELVITRNELSHDIEGNKIGIVSIKNVSNYTANIASVTGKFYDSNMNLVYSSTDTIVNLGPNETWDYTFTCMGANCSKVTTFKVDVTYN